MSAVHPIMSLALAAVTPRPARPLGLVHFTFEGLQGVIDRDDCIRYGGMAFQLEAASNALREAIEEARSHTVMIEIPRVSAEESIRAMADAAHILRESRPSTWSPSLTEQRLNYAIEELKQCANQR